MAKSIHYKGGAHVREIYAKDWQSVGVNDQELTRWEASNGHTVEVSDEAAKWLLENDSDNFEEVHKPAAKKATSSAT